MVRGGVLAGMLARVADGEAWGAWSRQVAHTGHCSRPVRVRGGASVVDPRTGEVRAEWSSDGEPDGTLLLACGDRRAAVCPACSETYRRDTWNLIAAGLRGRAPRLPGRVDAVPASVAGHPAVLATFTAPSFGAVHRAVSDGPCRERRGPLVCGHAVRAWCDGRHAADDPLVGRPLCWDCYDYTGHVLWHGAVPEVWRRTVIYLYRALARIGSERTGVPVTVRAVRSLVRVSYVKVAEYQRRGAVHLHAVIRLDGVEGGDRSAVVAPPAWADVTALEAAVRDAAGRVGVRLPDTGGRVGTVARWGGQLDVSPVSDPGRAAAYLAKYATKTAGDVFAGLPARRFSARAAGRVLRRVNNPHVGLLVAECLRLAGRSECAGLRLAEHVHSLGFRGHFATKSRWYSVTRATLGAVRRAWRTQRARERAGRAGGVGPDPWAEADDGGAVLVRDWRYLGTGWARLGDADLAASLARDHAAVRAYADIATTAWRGAGDE
ncbi:replication initiator [Actinomadura geliboluensis]|uniref:replication initiator n=1 Tax=Actinomadura geliboluensis TaxID=882440 RepID=UPI0026132ED4|nr:replication initiator [Actinomadura geliboluensis]